MPKAEVGRLIGVDEAIAGLLYGLANPENEEQLMASTDLTAREVFIFSFLRSVIDKLGRENVPIATNFFDSFLRFRISMWGEGRKEIIESTVGLREYRLEQQRAAAQLVKGLR